MASSSKKTAWHPLDLFSEMAGFNNNSALRNFEQKGKVKWTNTATLRTGVVHGLRYKVEKEKDGSPKIGLQHWLHWPGKDKEHSQNPEFITLKTETRTTEDGQTEIRPIQAIMGDQVYSDPAEIDKFMRFLQKTAKAIWRNISYNTSPLDDFNEASKGSSTKRDEIPNLFDIAEDTGFDKPIRLAGMYSNGEFKLDKPQKTDEPPVFTRQLLRAMLGIEETVLDKGDDSPFTKTYSLSNPEGGYEGISFSYVPGDDEGFSIKCDIWSTNEEGEKTTTPLYHLNFEPEDKNPDRLRLTDLEMLPDPHFGKPDLTDHQGVVRAIRAMKYIHLAVLKSEMPQVSQILYQHDLKSFIREPHKPEASESDPRISFELSTDPDQIGSNSVKVLRDFVNEKGEWVKQSYRLDAGASFTGPEDYYDSKMPDYSKDLAHPNSPHIKPDNTPLFYFMTHEHEDHLRGWARMVKFGFELPPLIMNPHTSRSFKRMMSEEGIKEKKRNEILQRSVILNPRLDPDQRNYIDDYVVPPKAKKTEEEDSEEDNNKTRLARDPETPEFDPKIDETHIFEDVVIRQRAEEIWSEQEKRYKYFPKLEIYHKSTPQSRVHMRIGPAGHSAHAMMCEVDGMLYTGDYKLDQTLPWDQRTDLDWLSKCTADIHFQESTNALNSDPDNPTVAEVRENRKKILREHKGDRVFADMIGSNAIDMFNFCDTLGEFNEELEEEEEFQYVIFAGTAVQRKYGDLNKTHELKKYLKNKYGITTLAHSEDPNSTVQKILKGELSGRVAIIGTGTQDEPVSITHRVSRNLHPSISLTPNDLVLRLQRVIPTGENYTLRAQQNQRFRDVLGCVVFDANEEAQKGNPIYCTSHTSKSDILLKQKVTMDPETGKGPMQLLFHGSPAHKKGLEEFLAEHDIKSFTPEAQGVYQVLKGQWDIELISEIPEEWSSYREIRGDPEMFFHKQRQQHTGERNPDKWFGQAAEALEKFEAHYQKRQKQKYRPTARGANLHDHYDDEVKTFPKIGIYGLETPGYLENYTNVGATIAMDSETTGRDPGTTVPISSSFVAIDSDGNELSNETIKHALPDYRIMGPGAALVTGTTDLHGLHAEEQDNRLQSRAFAEKLTDTYITWTKNVSEAQLKGTKEKRNKDLPPDRKISDEEKEENPLNLKVKGLFLTYRGTMFDDPVTMRMNGAQLIANRMKPMSTYGNITLDVFNLYSAFLALRPDETGSQKDEAGNYIRTLEVACSENGVTYKNAHDDLEDARMTGELAQNFKELDPELYEQMVMNADFKASGRGLMIDHILGQNLHHKDQAPVFGYVDRGDRKCRPHIGGLVTIDTKVSAAKHAIVVDLAKADIHQLENLSDEDLLEVMDDPDGPFASIKLHQSPMLFPPEFIYRNPKVRQRAVGRVPKTTIMQRANALKELRKDDDGPKPSFAQRVHELYPHSKLLRRPSENKMDGSAKISVPQAANDNTLVPFQVPSQRIFTLFHLVNNFKAIKNKYHRNANALLRLMVSKQPVFPVPSQKRQEKYAAGMHVLFKNNPAYEIFSEDRIGKTFSEIGRPAWEFALRQLQEIDKEAQNERGYRDPYIEDFRFLLEWMLDDMYPDMLGEEDKLKVSALKSAWLHAQVNEARKELEEIENDPEQFKKLVGKGPQAKKRWEELKANYLEYLDSRAGDSKHKITEEKELIIRSQWRKDSEKDDVLRQMRRRSRKKLGAVRPEIKPRAANP